MSSPRPSSGMDELFKFTDLIVKIKTLGSGPYLCKCGYMDYEIGVQFHCLKFYNYFSMPTKVVKHCIDSLLTAIIDIVNQPIT